MRSIAGTGHRWRGGASVACGAALVCGLVLNTAGAAWQPDKPSGGAAPLTNLLNEMGLQWLALESRLRAIDQQPRNVESQQAAAQILADFEALMTKGGWTNQQVTAVIPRLLSLARADPRPLMPTLQLALAQGEFILREQELMEYWRLPSASSLRNAQYVEMARVAGWLESIGNELAEMMRAQAFQGYNSQHISSMRLQALYARHLLFHGWACYYASLLDAQSADQWCQRAEQSFRKFLDVAADARLTQLPHDWLVIDTPWQARALLGLAVVCESCGRRGDADWCWQMIAAHAGATISRQEAHLWRFRALAWSGRTADAARFVQQVLDTHGVEDNRHVSHACLQFAVHRRGEGDDLSSRFFELGALPYLQHWRLDDLADQLGMLDIRWDDRSSIDHLLRAVLARRRVLTVASTRAETDSAVDEVTRHLEGARSAEIPLQKIAILAMAPLIMAELSYHKGEYDRALEWLSLARVEMSDQAPQPWRLAAEWLNVESCVQIAKRDRARLPDAWNAMASLSNAFPDSPQARQLAIVRAKLENVWLTPSESLDNLARLAGDEAFAEQIALERLFQLHRGWSFEASRDSAAAEPLRQLILDEWEALRRRGALHGEGLAAARLIVVDALLRGPSRIEAEIVLAKQLLAEHENDQERVPRARLTEEFHFQRMQLAKLQGDWEHVVVHAQWLRDHAREPVLERAGLVGLAQYYESVWEQGGRPADATARALRDVLMTLVERGREGVRMRQSDRAWRSAVKRLAECETVLGRPQRADQWYDQLLSNGSPDRELLRASGRIKMELEQWDQAANRWRELIAGVPAGSEWWFEARWQLSRCLMKIDPVAAERLRDQTLLLYPEMPPEWRERYQGVRRTEEPYGS